MLKCHVWTLVVAIVVLLSSIGYAGCRLENDSCVTKSPSSVLMILLNKGNLYRKKIIWTLTNTLKRLELRKSNISQNSPCLNVVHVSVLGPALEICQNSGNYTHNLKSKSVLLGGDILNLFSVRNSKIN